MNNHAKSYLEHNKNLTLLNGKIPMVDDWAALSLSRSRLARHTGNFGWVLGAKDLVIDVDKQNGGLVSYTKLVEQLSLELVPTVNTPSGGFHVYLSLGDGMQGRLRKTLRDYPGIDFLSKGAQCVIAGSMIGEKAYEWVDDFLGTFEQTPCPKGLFDLLKVVVVDEFTDTPTNIDADDVDASGLMSMVGGSGSAGWSEDRVKQFLNKLDHNMPNGEWVKVGMALYNWDRELGLSLWDAWSVGGDTYKEGECEKRWRSFENVAGGVTLGTLVYMAKSADFDEQHKAIEDLFKRIASANERDLMLDVIPGVKKMTLDSLSLETINGKLKSRLKELTGVMPKISDIRRLTAPVLQGEVDDWETTQKPNWCSEWVYVNSHSSYFHLPSTEMMKSEAFNLAMGKNIPMGESGVKQSATRWVAEHGFVDIVHAMAYVPMSRERLIMIDGHRYVNSFDHGAMPLPADTISDEAAAFIAQVENHIRLLCNDDERLFSVLIQWIAHNIQNPGAKLLWSPIIQSIEGVGKSFIGQLFETCLGTKAVGKVSPTQVTSQFNGWAANVVVNVLEELRVKGHNRYDVVNAVKPLITDSRVQINEKGVKPYVTYNTTNYIAFTNYRDALPVDETDRRWFVIYTELANLAELEAKVQKPVSEYFPELFQGLRDYAGEVLRHFLSYPIGQDFLSLKQAPMTIYKQMMIATEGADDVLTHQIKDVIDAPGPFHGGGVIAMPSFFEHIQFDIPDVMDLSNREKNVIFKKLGYSLLPGRVRVKGRMHQLWSTRALTTDEAKRRLDIELD